MNKILYTLLFVAVIGLQANAQGSISSLSHKLYPGTITKPGGEVVKGYVFNRGESGNQDKCIFWLDAADERTRTEYKPTDLIAYSIENVQYKTVNYSGNMPFGKASPHFLMIDKAGAISELAYFQSGTQLVIQKGDEDPISTTKLLLNFRGTMMKLVADDKELADKIDRKEKGYGRLETEAIISEYNTWAASKK